MHTGRTSLGPASEAETQRLRPSWDTGQSVGERDAEFTPSFLLPEVGLLAAVRPSSLLPLCPSGPS